MLAAQRPDWLSLLLITGLALGGLTFWDSTSLDIALARAVGGPEGFPFRDSWVLNHVLHDGARRLAWVLVTVLALSVWWPMGPLRRLDLPSLVQLAVTPLLVSFCVSALKWFSLTSCPWDLNLFGGWARYASHWSTLADGGSGHCFPAGHASAGFAFIGGYFVFRNVAPATARIWLQASLASGFVLGIAQQVRGAHFMSHTLWTAFVSWCVAFALDAAMQAMKPRAVTT